ncbi:hypothetical protein [Siphonobacter sp. SORGH_AS_0500]|uniref:hypothetical protein n=1 Tax=Siphonobacter sp. SORGH_AS_0500 TaxID=1864824 RepID=UPI0028552EC4|nr:hypothetical protein [Siphonobacter sp. SORGH_AS_0500]MDR6194924.1 lipopolysaccharide export LptBFGC system permease protein LptF [Siphonobacter sp. SORGH_AS_0500]
MFAYKEFIKVFLVTLAGMFACVFAIKVLYRVMKGLPFEEAMAMYQPKYSHVAVAGVIAIAVTYGKKRPVVDVNE